jgi:hypothetical protein
MKNKKILIYPSIASKQYELLMKKISENGSNVKEKIEFLRNKKIECKEHEISIEELINRESNGLVKEFTDKDLFFSLREICAANRLFVGQEDELKNIYINLYYKIKEYLIKENIKKIISYSLSDGVTMTLYNLSNELGIKFNYLINTRIGEGVMNSTRADTGPENFELKFNENKRKLNDDKVLYKEYSEKLKDFIDSKVQPKYASDKKLSSQKFFDLNLKNLKNKIISSFKGKDNTFIEIGLIELINKRFSRYFQINYYHKNITVNNIEDLKDLKYIVFPLHYHPESSTLINGRWINDQIKIIQLIVANMPPNYKLIVKEHKVAMGRRPLLFYKDILKIPDVVLANENFFMGDLIKKSYGIITIAGTAGLEAYLIGKKVGVIGDVYYMYLPGVVCMHDIKSMRKNIESMINGQSIKDIDRMALYKTLICEGRLIDNFLPTNLEEDTIQGMMSLLFKC